MAEPNAISQTMSDYEAMQKARRLWCRELGFAGMPCPQDRELAGFARGYFDALNALKAAGMNAERAVSATTSSTAPQDRSNPPAQAATQDAGPAVAVPREVFKWASEVIRANDLPPAAYHLAGFIIAQADKG